MPQISSIADLRRFSDLTPAGCWLWTATKPRPNGYCLAGKSPRQYVHRIAYTLARGTIPDGMTVDHVCFNTTCVNPSHLRILTRQQNAAYKRSKISMYCKSGRHLKTPENHRPLTAGGRAECHPCRLEKRKIQYEANHEQEIKKRRIQRGANKERINALWMVRYMANREANLQKQREKYLRRKARAAAAKEVQS